MSDLRGDERKTILHNMRIRCFEIGMSVAVALNWMVAAYAAGIYENRGVEVTPEAIRCAEASGREIFSRGFADPAAWEKPDYNAACMGFAWGGTDGNAMVLTVTTNRPAGTHWDTYVSVRTKPIALPPDVRRCRVSFLLEADYSPAMSCGGFEPRPHRNEIVWFDATGKELSHSSLDYTAGGRNAAEIRIDREVPYGAASCSVCIGFDRRDIPLGKRAVFRNLKLSALGTERALEPAGSFVSEVGAGGWVSWDAEAPPGTSVGLQYASGATPQEAVSAPFSGPDGSADSYYAEPFDAEGPFVRYRVVLRSGKGVSPALRSVTVGARTDRDWSLVCDAEPPLVYLRSPSPFADPQQELSLEIRDETPVVWDRLRVVVDGLDRTREVRRSGARLSLPAPEGGWTNGLHEARVHAEDFRGNGREAYKCFLRGPGPTTRPVTLREDGMAMLGGRPFFPIGICHVLKSPFNAWDFDRAISDLKAAGFNTVQSWWNMYSAQYRDTLEKYGMKVYFGMYYPRPFAYGMGRDEDPIIAWYIADDTSDNTTAADLLDRHEAFKAVDPSRLTIHASETWSSVEVSNFRGYADKADAYLPEIYPVRGGWPERASNCVAVVVRDMMTIRADIARVGGAHSVWPIIQFFRREPQWLQPTPEEFRAMCFAAVVNGANGIMFYAYDEITREENLWRTAKSVATELSGLIPVLVDDAPAPAVAVEILSGPKEDAFGHPSVTCLAKRHGGRTHVFAVNATRERVDVRFRLSDGCTWQESVGPLGVVVRGGE